ncbi:MAG: Zn-ribbon domain-containing OB-fold protein [Deltaproteobacteria bacterium]|nr:Zn-ribbon domain-containing OB-fold protein [Deltaproteobacteria bacterium]
MKNKNVTLPETDEGTILFNVPFPKNLETLKSLSPIIIKQPYHIDYIHSYGQDSPWFAALANKKLLGNKCQKCGDVFATPRLSCSECGSETDWVELPQEGRLHTFTICHFGAEAFLKETPFMLGLIEFEGVKTLLLSRVMGFDLKEPSLQWVGTKVKAKFRRNSQFKPTDVYFIPV